MIPKPFHRNCRPFKNGEYTACHRYIRDKRYADSPEQYVRAYQLIQKDLLELFDYVEPADVNCKCFSFRIHSLLIRACVEVEANCKAILTENGYAKSGGDLNMTDYKKIEKSHRLSQYEVKAPTWHGNRAVWQPFAQWASASPLPWYQAYNATKHDRHLRFDQATFEHLMSACCGLLVLLMSQFHREDFSAANDYLELGSNQDGMESGIGSYFRVRFPTNWPIAESYDFVWLNLVLDPQPFEKFDYTKV